ncbi:MAG: cytochrome C biogenesis protein [Gammaproteobacteria bacterium]|nr:cytochrome C biogenesis protein [Gammaproteobacteria bacterium]
MKFLYFLIFIFSINILSESLYNFKNEDDEARFNKLIKDIRCPKCISGSLSSSNAPISEDLKLKILEMITENKTDQEIKDYVTLRFGNESLYEPEFNKTTYILWFSPFLILVFSLLIFLLRKKT